MRTIVLMTALTVAGCNPAPSIESESVSNVVPQAVPAAPSQSLLDARAGFVTKIVTAGEDFGDPDSPEGSMF